jgi:hypothetical protein
LLRNNKEAQINKAFGLFSCRLNPDIESFLKKSSVRFERAHKSRTYLYLDEDRFPDFYILGYFTIALKTMEIKTTASKSLLKKLDGISGKSKKNLFPVFLLGQLGRCTTIDKGELSGLRILTDVLSLIHIVQKFIGGRIILVECEDKPFLKEFYQRNGFQYLQESQENYNRFLQYVKFIN